MGINSELSHIYAIGSWNLDDANATNMNDYKHGYYLALIQDCYCLLLPQTTEKKHVKWQQVVSLVGQLIYQDYFHQVQYIVVLMQKQVNHVNHMIVH